ncbi:hypothetical protein SLH46_06025 [Draconibacterium sp. IB214405]|uniref:hypothetical protein n=1 Tax=Draconibacterium sp. IB214405 TaxID=3097352 RepID=UPI002A0AE9A8|nr:hypothetical protein [Draconibacterium sp. IB214405]MDX8338729.1 hypothetical protein [Draconibacterium sp. IB214405]
MKKSILLFVVCTLILVFAGCEKNFVEDPVDSLELKSGNSGNDKLNGFDEWGFNWNAHHFNGYLMNAVMGDYLYDFMPFYKWNEGPYQGEGDEFIVKFVNEFGFFPIYPSLLDCKLVMHWNDALITKDGIYPVYAWDYSGWVDSNAWITFHYSMDKDGEKWSSFQKLVAQRATDYLEDGVWYNENDEAIGLASDWPTLILIKKVNTGNVPDMFMDSYNSPLAPGLGKYKI